MPKHKGRPRKLSRDAVKEIREMYFARPHPPMKRGYSMVMLARIFKVSEGTIQQVLDRKGTYAQG